MVRGCTGTDHTAQLGIPLPGTSLQKTGFGDIESSRGGILGDEDNAIDRHLGSNRR